MTTPQSQKVPVIVGLSRSSLPPKRTPTSLRLPLHSPLHSGMPRMKGQPVSILPLMLAFLTLPAQNPKSYFTPLRLASRRSVKCRGFASGGSAFSFRPAVFFDWWGGRYVEMDRTGRRKASFPGVSESRYFRVSQYALLFTLKVRYEVTATPSD